MEIGDIYVYVYIYIDSTCDFTLVAQAYVMWAELSVCNFYSSNHWKWALKMIFKGTVCFQFPEAVVLLQ